LLMLCSEISRSGSQNSLTPQASSAEIKNRQAGSSVGIAFTVCSSLAAMIG
jgi:hypothetical protein